MKDSTASIQHSPEPTKTTLHDREELESIRVATPPFSRKQLHQEPIFSDMLHKVGHDIGNPLTAIVSIAALIERFPQEHAQITPEFIERTRRYGASIAEEAWRIAALNEKLVLLLSERQPNFDSVDIRQTIDRALSKARSRLGDKRIFITHQTVRAGEEVPIPTVTISSGTTSTASSVTGSSLSVLGDFDQLLVVFTEILTNAYQVFRHEDQGINTNNLVPSAPPPVECVIQEIGDSISICFSNPQPSAFNKGPVERNLADLFLPGITTYSDSKHTGLGLSTIWSTIERMGGTVNIADGETKDGKHRFFTEIVLPSAN